jgi:hypothetical protein
MKAYGRVDVKIQVFLTSALVGGEWSDSRSARFTPGKRASPYPLGMRLGGPQNQSGRRGEEKILDLTGARTPTSRPSSPYSVAIPTALSRSSYIPLNVSLWKKRIQENLLYQLTRLERRNRYPSTKVFECVLRVVFPEDSLLPWRRGPSTMISGTALDLCLGCDWFGYQRGHQLFWWDFRGFVSPGNCRDITSIRPQPLFSRFISNSLFIQSSYYSMLHSLRQSLVQ